MLLLGIFFTLAATAAAAYHFSQRYKTTRPSKDKVNAFAKSRPGSTLSIVVPCYNEEDRLPPMLVETIKFCDSVVKSGSKYERSAFVDYEIIVVDDCSTDRTAAVAEEFVRNHKETKFQVLRVRPNHGKGHAVRAGFFASSGEYVLMADGDNATQISDVEKLLVKLQESGVAGKQRAFIAVGSRAHLETKSISERTLFRTILMKAFHLVVKVTYFVCTLGHLCKIRDTQCGFKVFRRKETEILFLNNRLERWAFDVEILLLAKRFGFETLEVPVNWKEIPGSKVRFWGMAQMGLECVLMCFTYTLGFWTILRQ